MAYQSLLTGGRPQITLTNSVSNGNFVDTSDWNAWSNWVTIAAASNTLSATGTGTNAILRVWQDDLTQPSDKKYFIKCRVKVSDGTGSGGLTIWVRDGGAGAVYGYVALQTNPVSDQWYEISQVLEFGTIVNNVRYIIETSYPSAAAANGKVLSIQQVAAINLTDVFGSGSEPTAAQMDRWLTIFSAGWFDTTKSIPKRIY